MLGRTRPGGADPELAGVDLPRLLQHRQGYAAERLETPGKTTARGGVHGGSQPTGTGPAASEHRESVELLRQAILGLREEEKEVFLLRQNGDLTYEQIAELRQVPIGTVKTQMRSALDKLRKLLN